MSKTPPHHPIDWTAKAARDYSVPTLVKALEDENACHAAAESLGSLGADAKDAVPALIKALTITPEVDCGQEEDDAEMDQAEAEEWKAGFHRLVAEALGKIGPDACEAVPALIGLLIDEDDDIRRTAAGSLGAIGPGAAQAAPDLLRVLDGGAYGTDRERENIIADS